MKKAAAIKYTPGEKAPVLICKGRRHLADKLIQEAEFYGIPLIKNNELLDEVIELSPMEYIPEEMYRVVAEILSFVYAHGNGKQ
ncbi:MAG: EscU/YscU/HrcU family type III secretion system export apparatus switch protein [Spirochaetales bacterium]|nr:EscU/YscU/HrcU family type III secretion system export apparatus switch protein [Spirochaetales bacterium]